MWEDRDHDPVRLHAQTVAHKSPCGPLVQACIKTGSYVTQPSANDLGQHRRRSARPVILCLFQCVVPMGGRARVSLPSRAWLRCWAMPGYPRWGRTRTSSAMR
jgi:hypothetical protein